MLNIEYVTAAQIKEKWYSSDEEADGSDTRTSETTCSTSVTPADIIQSLAGQVSSGRAVDTNIFPWLMKHLAHFNCEADALDISTMEVALPKNCYNTSAKL